MLWGEIKQGRKTRNAGWELQFGQTNKAEEWLRVDKTSPGVLMLPFLTADHFILQQQMFEYVPSFSVTVNTPASDWGAIQEQ